MPMQFFDDRSFWGTIPRKSVFVFLLGVFVLFCTFGFVGDAMGLAQAPLPRYVLGILLAGLFSTLYALSGMRFRGRFWVAFFPLLILQVIVMNVLGNAYPDIPFTPDRLPQLTTRLHWDGWGTIVCVGLGYTCFIWVFINEAKRYARVHSEIILASEIHGVLVPPITARSAYFENAGRSLPSGEVGGDLIDVFQNDKGWIAYIADVSGHGVAPGIVMAMVKSAIRMELVTERGPSLLERLNSVIYPIKKPDMFVTIAYLSWNGRELEYSVAGHPPILHYDAVAGSVNEIVSDNMPVGILPDQQFVAGALPYRPGDVFLFMTDGILEVANQQGVEFGVAGVKSVFARHTSEPPEAILQAVLTAARAHGQTADDQSLLVVRCISPA